MGWLKIWLINLKIGLGQTMSWLIDIRPRGLANYAHTLPVSLHELHNIISVFPRDVLS